MDLPLACPEISKLLQQIVEAHLVQTLALSFVKSALQFFTLLVMDPANWGVEFGQLAVEKYQGPSSSDCRHICENDALASSSESSRHVERFTSHVTDSMKRLRRRSNQPVSCMYSLSLFCVGSKVDRSPIHSDSGTPVRNDLGQVFVVLILVKSPENLAVFLQRLVQEIPSNM